MKPFRQIVKEIESEIFRIYSGVDISKYDYEFIALRLIEAMDVSENLKDALHIKFANKAEEFGRIHEDVSISFYDLKVAIMESKNNPEYWLREQLKNLEVEISRKEIEKELRESELIEDEERVIKIEDEDILSLLDDVEEDKKDNTENVATIDVEELENLVFETFNEEEWKEILKKWEEVKGDYDKMTEFFNSIKPIYARKIYDYEKSKEQNI